ncbi:MULTISPECIES: anti-sigma factor antagonist [unclassified Streptomyces]|uniref:anti-sigma factor antagonist n=1 Tax=unclassified Streptomyces TaxID=2593676 RepID=UPI0023B332AD|nr:MULTISPECIES: anti-sigma factor antagonist [unclassified Streptomyces]
MVRVAGEIDLHNAPALRTGALNLIAQGHPRLILDLTAVTFCDSSGFSGLIGGIMRCAKDAGGSLSLAAVPNRLARMLDLTGISTLMPSYPTAADALDAHATAREMAALNAARPSRQGDGRTDLDTLTDALGGADDDLLAAWPRVPTDIRIGYARVSTGSQKIDRQLDALNGSPGCRRVFADKKSSNNDQRPELKACLAFMAEATPSRCPPWTGCPVR